jgi:hypothetical protein
VPELFDDNLNKAEASKLIDEMRAKGSRCIGAVGWTKTKRRATVGERSSASLMKRTCRGKSEELLTQ